MTVNELKSKDTEASPPNPFVMIDEEEPFVDPVLFNNISKAITNLLRDGT